MAATGKQLKQSVKVFHSLMLYRLLPIETQKSLLVLLFLWQKHTFITFHMVVLVIVNLRLHCSFRDDVSRRGGNVYTQFFRKGFNGVKSNKSESSRHSGTLLE